PSQLSVTAPPSFDEVVRRAMAKRPEDRFASAKEFAEAIRAAMTRQAEPRIAETEATMVSAPSPQHTAATSASPEASIRADIVPPRSKMPMIAGGVALVVLAVLGGAWWLQSSPQAPSSVATVNIPTPTPAPAAKPEPQIGAAETTPAPQAPSVQP